jgi:hypothetical protein
MGERSVPEVGTHVDDYEDGLVGYKVHGWDS